LETTQKFSRLKEETAMADITQTSENPEPTFAEIRLILKESAERLAQDDERRAREAQERAEERARIAQEREQEALEMAQERARIALEMARIAKERAEDEKRRDEKEARAIEEMRRTIRETDRQIGALGNRFGELAEHLVAPNIIEKFNALGYEFDDVASDRRIGRFHGGESVEVDILLENEKYSIAVEVKAKPKETDVDRHIERLEFLRRHKDKHHDSRKLRGAIAGAIMPDAVRNYTLKAGFYVIEQTGDTVKIDMPKGFTPREW
jgi:hypothetical protein